jgi:mRNA interferase MazF
VHARGRQGGAAGKRQDPQPLDDWFGEIADEGWSEDAEEFVEQRRAAPVRRGHRAPEADTGRDRLTRSPPQARAAATTEARRGAVERRRLPASRAARGHEQRGARYAVIVQAEEFLGLSTVLVSPTSASARAASFRPTITLAGQETRVLVEQTTVVDPGRLGRSAGRLDASQLLALDEALMLVLGL